MFAVAAFVLLGSFAQPAPWLNDFLGADHEAVMSYLKFDEESNLYEYEEKKLAFDVSGNPTSLVWVMPTTFSDDEEFSTSKLLTQLGFDGSKAEMIDWNRGEYQNRLLTNLPGLKKGWRAFAGEYSVLFVGPDMSGDFSPTGPAVKADRMAEALSTFCSDPTWRGAVKGYGKAHFMEWLDKDNSGYSWKGEGPVLEVRLYSYSEGEKSANFLKEYRTDDKVTYSMRIFLKPGFTTWEAAFAAVGLNPTGAKVIPNEESSSYITFKNVRGLNKKWFAYAEFIDGNIDSVGFNEVPTDEEFPSHPISKYFSNL